MVERSRLPVALLVVCLLLYSPHAQGAAGVCVPFEQHGQQLVGSELSYVYMCPPQQGWKALELIWAPLNVNINCSSNAYTVLTANTKEQLEAGNGTAIRWCGLKNMLSEPNVCQFTLSPLQEQYFAVDTGPGGIFSGLSSFECRIDSSREASLRHMVLTVVGVVLFFNAARLTMSDTFRLTSGSLMFMSGAVLVLAFVLMRSMPYKKSLMALFTISTSSLLAVVRWLYGTWLPDAYTVVTSRPFIGYLMGSGLLGLAVTYWMDDKNNVKLNTTIRVTLQLVAVSMVYMGVADERVAVAAMLLLISSKVLAAIGRRFAQLLYFLGKSLVLLVRLAARTVKLLATATWRAVFGGSRPRPIAGGPQTASAPRQAAAAAGASLRNAAGSPLPEDAEPLLSDEEHDRAATTRRRHRQQAAQLDRDLSLEAWKQPTPTHGAGECSPLRYRFGPPLSPNVLAVQPDLQQQSPAFWRPRQVGVFGGAPAAAEDDEVGYRFPSFTSPAPRPVSQALPRTPPSTSSWGRERVVVDLNTKAPSPSQAAAPVDSSRPASAAAAYVHPRIAEGKIRNPLTGRDITLHGTTYKSLLEKGYKPFWQAGELVLPDGAAAGASGSSRLSARSPAGSTRQRTPRSTLTTGR